MEGPIHFLFLVLEDYLTTPGKVLLSSSSVVVIVAVFVVVIFIVVVNAFYLIVVQLYSNSTIGDYLTYQPRRLDPSKIKSTTQSRFVIIVVFVVILIVHLAASIPISPSARK